MHSGSPAGELPNAFRSGIADKKYDQSFYRNLINQSGLGSLELIIVLLGLLSLLQFMTCL